MKERPILFSAPMVRAILDGRKTQTRRVIKPAPNLAPDIDERLVNAAWQSGHVPVKCPYGVTGDRLWVRETWRAKPYSIDRQHPAVEYRASMKYEGTTPNGKALDALVEKRAPWKPSIHMPRWASRITLEVTGVRVERLQEISESDCIAEGAEAVEDGELMPDGSGGVEWSHRLGYMNLWRDINGADSWAANPWVWVIEFKRVPA